MSEEDQNLKSIQFNFMKANNFRVIHADGAIGAQTPRGGLFFTLFSERLAIPESFTHQLNADGTLGNEIPGSRRSKPGIVRELEVGVSMDLTTATDFHKWLGSMLQTVELSKKKKDESV